MSLISGIFPFRFIPEKSVVLGLRLNLEFIPLFLGLRTTGGCGGCGGCGGGDDIVGGCVSASFEGFDEGVADEDVAASFEGVFQTRGDSESRVNLGGLPAIAAASKP